MTIAAILRDKGGEVVEVAPDTTVRAFVDLLTERRIGAAPVVDRGRIVGIISERDVIHALQRGGVEILDAPVVDVMTAPAITVTADVPPIAALSLMTRRRFRHLPVVDGDRLIGFVSIGDLVKARIEGIEREAEAMRAYIAG